jgi:hypothetical protein
MTTKCTAMTHEWVAPPGSDGMDGVLDRCGNCGAGRFEEARVYQLEQHAEKVHELLGTALGVIESFRPLADAARAHLATGDALRLAVAGIADMLADADASAAASGEDAP